MSLTYIEYAATYSNLSDEKISKLANIVNQLTPEALQALKNEAITRKLPIVEIIDNQFKIREVFNEWVDRYCFFIENLPCPICQKKDTKLKAIKVQTVVSFIIMTNTKKKIHIGCISCLNKELSNAKWTSLFLGWWGIPFGVWETINSIGTNSSASRDLNNDLSSKLMKSIIVAELNKYNDFADLEEHFENLLCGINN